MKAYKLYKRKCFSYMTICRCYIRMNKYRYGKRTIVDREKLRLRDSINCVGLLNFKSISDLSVSKKIIPFLREHELIHALEVKLTIVFRQIKKL